MSDDYLWDKTGEPDPEIVHLEQVLSSLRYQPKPFAVPANLKIKSRRNFIPPLAVAAAIVMMILAAGLWLSLHRSGNGETADIPTQLTSTPEVPIAVVHK